MANILENLISKSLYTNTSIEYLVNRSPNEGFETLIQTIYNNDLQVNDKMFKFKKVWLPDGTFKLEHIPNTTEEIERIKLLNDKDKKIKDYYNTLKHKNFKKLLINDSDINSIINKFWKKVNIKEENECWNWIGALDSGGHGHLVHKEKDFKARKISWLIHHGNFPDGNIYNTCNNQICVNPKHLSNIKHVHPCSICGNMTNIYKTYCSLECRNKSYIGKRHTEEHILHLKENAKINSNYGMKGKHHTEESNKNNSDNHKGSIPWNIGSIGLQDAWNKGLTKETSEIVKKYSESGSKTIKLQYKNGRIVDIKAGISKHGYRLDLKHNCRSSWESNICRILKFQNIEYQYEPKIFDLGDCTYLPDIFIPSENMWIEVKGWRRKEGMNKFNKFIKLYPNENIILLGKEEYDVLIKAFCNKIKFE